MGAPVGMQGKGWQNPDLYKIANGLGTTDTNEVPVPYLAQVLDALEIFRLPTQNRLIKTFNINASFTTDLQEWYNSGVASLIISTEYIQDENGTNLYLITYA